MSHAGLNAKQYTVDLTVGPTAVKAGTIPKGSTRYRHPLELPAEAKEATIKDIDLYEDDAISSRFLFLVLQSVQNHVPVGNVVKFMQSKQ